MGQPASNEADASRAEGGRRSESSGQSCIGINASLAGPTHTTRMITAQPAKHVPEKLDVVKRSHRVFAEYGNVGTEFEYIPMEGFGWMNASYQVGLAYLSPELAVRLNSLIPPEWLFE